MNEPANPLLTSERDALIPLEERIKQLGDKANQLLLFLSFALVVAAILETTGNKLGDCQRAFLTIGIRFWASAIFPILISVLPVKEIRERSHQWYNVVRWSKFGLLWVAICLILVGGIFFLCATWHLGFAIW